MISREPRWSDIGLVFVLYYLGARMGVSFTSMPEGIAILWPPNAVLLAAYLLFGWRRYPAIALAALSAEVAADLPTFTLIEALSFGLLNIGEATFSAFLLRRLRFNFRFQSLSDVPKFLIAGPLLGSLAAAIPGALIYAIFRGGETPYLEFMRIWWFGDGLGLLILTPLLLELWPQSQGQTIQQHSLVGWRYTTIATMVLLTGSLILAGQDGRVYGIHLSPVLLLPAALYIAYRFDLRATSKTVAALAAIVIVATTKGINPFGATDPRMAVIQAQEFVFILSLMALGFSALLAQLRQRQSALELSNAALDDLNRSLEARVQKRTEELARLNAQLAEQALTDSLTGALNRRGLYEAAARELIRSGRYGGGMALVLFDLDRFKAINDRYGHDAGDAVLRSAAQAVRGTIRESDVFARHGGEEFAVLAPGTHADSARHLAEKMRLAIGSARPLGSELPPVSASFGVALLRPGEDFATLMQRADQLLYQAKQGGRNRVASETEAHTVQLVF